ncbi:bifunctional phosphoribosylaminoimidazolecarboxamide formyltransferase/IMP cyclohydrolase [Rhodobaculum claviforme]|uniref:Bifunctional purine biosynthesis protein PurH n=1 Tax=Rhodobaculum claviforme TaxID=1549854 RepID=A0A934WJH6_9RHOB|nr:bifunctional phosphoribosylaminoimidazolecarboxamide formyltransferase/IMP cyclohydrolase [Rhodobaculum claviforme]MBK5927508.1 bifunctional phosphoribosylaminoimidazolecarboxamide formyltransferase/IMP cyclohydrolase [Rhodobaculum claviforme]
MTAHPTPIRRALISVSDKTGLDALAAALAARGVEVLSTGGTAAQLRKAGLSVRDVAEVTGSPEMLDGRVKTLHPRIHGGLLARRADPAHVAALRDHGIPEIDLLVVNLYPFEATVARGAGYDDCVEMIDIGGPAMIRAAAKNHGDVTVLTDPADYPAFLEEIEHQGGATTPAFRRAMALAAFGRTAAYDAAVSTWLASALEQPAPPTRAFAGRLAQPLRYGENPHQRAAFYTDGSDRPGVATARQVQGKELSYNNINDTDAAFELVSEFAHRAGHAGGAACVIVKHANPCGVATGDTLRDAYVRAFDCDRTSAYGGIVAVNQPLDGPAAEAICEIFTEVVIAPGADAAALKCFAAKPNLRLLLTDALADPAAPGLSLRQVAGGLLVQDRDADLLDEGALRVVTKRSPTPAERADLLFAWTVAKHVKSNAIVYARGGATVGIGAGQMSRVDSTRIAARKAADMAEALGLDASPAKGAVVASDAFFPFPDGLITAAEAGATAVIQPGGSLRDQAVIDAADAAGLAMLFTGRRHFRH